jgi:adenylosuccinate lyase
MADSYGHDSFLSPFAWRYGTVEMRAIWSEEYKLRLWRRIWVALAEAQCAAGLISAEQVADLRAHAGQVDIARTRAIEAQVRHDLVAEVHAFAEQCPTGGGVIHLGATSMDVKDNADAFRLREALDLLLGRLAAVLETLAAQIEEWAETPVIAWTHIQPAEPTTLGYRLAQYGQDLLLDLAELQRVRAGIRGKGFKGAVGTSASYAQLLNGTGMTPAELEARVMATLEMEAFPVTTQTYPRRQDWLVLNALAGLAGSLYKFAFDLRLLQTPPIGEWAEPFGRQQVGSSAMPFKRNPENAETMNSLARLVAALPRVAWDNAAHSLLERTLDDSANRRTVLPEAFLAADELLVRAGRLLREMRVNEAAMARNLAVYGTFAATERLLMELVRAGADRQAMHEVIRRQSMAAWTAVEAGQPNPLAELLAADRDVLLFLSAERVSALMDAAAYVGDAPQRARALAAEINRTLTEMRSWTGSQR